MYEAATRELTEPMDFYRLTRAVLDQSEAHAVVYTEAFLSPDFCGYVELGPWREYLSAIQEAAQEAEKAHGIVMKGSVTCIRHFVPDKAKHAAFCAAETSGDFICGFGMGGAESVRQAIFDLKVERLGHGVQVIEDSHLLDEVIARKIMLEVCPGSNVALGIYPDTHSHPIEKLRNLGVNILVSTDDPPFFHTDMTKEYTALSCAFGWGKEDFKALNKTALITAFCNNNTKDKLIKRLDTE